MTVFRFVRLSAAFGVFCSLAALMFAGPIVLAHESTSGGVTVAHPWMRATPEGANVGVGFLEIKTDAATTDRLVSAQSPVAGRVEIHTHLKDGDVVRMRKLETLDLAPGQSTVFKPGGLHFMLMELKAPLKQDELVALTLVFEKAGKIEVEATVEPVGALGPHGMTSQPDTTATPSGSAEPDAHANH